MQNAAGDAAEAFGTMLSPVVINISGYFKTAAEKASEFFRDITETRLEKTIREMQELGVSGEALLRLQNLQIDKEISSINNELTKLNDKNLTGEQIEQRLVDIGKEKEKQMQIIADLEAEDIDAKTEKFHQEMQSVNERYNTERMRMEDSNATRKDFEDQEERKQKALQALRDEYDLTQVDREREKLQNLADEELGLALIAAKTEEIIKLDKTRLENLNDDVNANVDVEPFTKDEDAEFFGEDEKKSFDDYSEAMFNKMVVDEQAKQQEEERLRLRKQFIATYPEEAAQLGMLTEEQAKLEKIKEKFSLKAKAVKIRETLSNTFQGANALYKQYVSTYPPPLGQIIGAAAYIATIQKGKKDVEQIKKAQYGADFVTSGPEMLMVGEGSGPERVQVTPLVDPNIDGPQGQGATINITGNVMSDDFVENTLIEKIREATRMGENLGA